MDASAGRCFLDVYRDGCDEPRRLQLQPTVKFHNVLKVFGRAGDLYWYGQRIDPQTTPAAVGMSCGIDQANTLWFIPAPPRSQLCAVSRVGSTAPLDSPSSADATMSSAFHLARSTSLLAHFDDRSVPWQRNGHNADSLTLIGARIASLSADHRPSWYSRPLLLSPVPPPLPPPAVTRLSSAVQASLSHQPTRSSPPSANAARPPPAAAPIRRNAAVCIDPHILVDPTSDAVETLQRELRLLSYEVRAMQCRDRLDFSPMRQPAVRPPRTTAASVTGPGVEELATELHDRQMRRLYDQRRLCLNLGPRG
ncbi:hypothetical protein LSCM1_01784 [Leishmania martiniquensis]|uniref:Uncharacterized protein n=1 Tax=Leishmania martiniquensis TaxID=1580590 RepID=A0A836KH54_9TRYP|nr:hypothetical protein LSCM1_01784 [Leishmania martiniquensis]